MGSVVDGQWQIGGRIPDQKGRFLRKPTHFHDRITADGSSGHPAESGRYHLYVSWACPWAHRTLILRTLLGLEDAISVSVVDAFMGEKGWAFSDHPGATQDHLFAKRYLHQVYIHATPGYTGRASVPVLFDKVTGTIVNNESREIIRMFDTECAAMSSHASGEIPSFLPSGKEAEVDAAIDAFYEAVNNGVYKSGFAKSQEAYEEAVQALFESLDHWEDVLSHQRYLCGDVITEADWCLFTTLVRFDPVYHFHFKCNRHRLRDYPNLWHYTKDLYQVPGVAETCNMAHIKQHYFASHETVNPTRIIPVGPEIDYTTPHDRARTYGA